jgi:tellurite resistance protein TerC
VVSANAFALLGLRALYFLLVGLLDRLVYLSYGLAIILAFIGVKLILHYLHTDISTSIPEISTGLSLGVVVGVLAVTTVLSLRASKDPAKRSHALTGPPAE